MVEVDRTAAAPTTSATALAAAAPPFMVLRPHDVLALRAGASAQDVLNFKARVDELSRLAAGRAEDEALIAQIEARLQKLDPSATARS